MFKPCRNAYLAAFVALIAVSTLHAANAYPVRAQPGDTGTVCVIAYDDANRNGVRDPGEDALLDVNINLMLPTNVVIANHVTTEREPYCFEQLAPQQYMLHINSPLYDALDAAPVSFSLPAGQRMTYEFGAVARPPDQADDPSSSILYVPLTLTNRIGLGIAAALGVIVLLTGLGLIIYGLFLHRRPVALEEDEGELAAEGPWQQTGAPGWEHYAERAQRSQFDAEFDDYDKS